MDIDRSLLTDLILVTLVSGTDDPPWHVGDHEKPKEGGWQGEESRSQFIPYVVLTALPSQQPTGPMEGSEGDVNFPYGLTCLGDSRKMVDVMSFNARKKVRTLAREKTGDGRTIGQVRVTRYGGVDRISREPPLYVITDQILFWTTR